MITDSSLIQAILDNTPENIVLIGKNHEILAFNKTIKEVLAEYFGREIKLGDKFYPDFVVESSKELYINSFDQAINGKPVIVENLTENENTSIWFEFRMIPVYDKSEQLIGVSLSGRNIDKSKRAEIEIKSLSDQFKAILESTDESIILLDPNYKLLALNNVAYTVIKTNTNLEAKIGSDFRSYIRSSDNPLFKQFSDALKGISSEVESHYTNIHGKQIWYILKCNPVYNMENKLLGVSIFSKDISEKKQIELQLIESEDKFKKIINLAPIGIIITDKKMQISFSNYAAQKLFNYSNDSFLDLSLTEILKDFKVLKNGSLKIGNVTIEIESLQLNQDYFQGKTGKKENIDLLVSSSSYLFHGEPFFIFLIQDISELVIKDNTILNQKEILKDIAWHQSHIIRAPVARILGLINLMQDQIFDLSEEEKTIYLNHLNQSAIELDKVIHDIVTKTYDKS